MQKKTKIMLCFFLVSFGFVEANSFDKVFARATKFHKNDSNCDPWTYRGETSTQIRLRENCDNTIGMVAVDPKIIPYGSLIYSPQNKRFYLACNKGGAVTARTAAKRLAKTKGLSKKYYDALVLDFYAPREIINNHFDYFFIIEHEGPDFRFDLKKKEQKLRLDPNFWLEKSEKILKDEKKHKNELKEMINRLRKMI